MCSGAHMNGRKSYDEHTFRKSKAANTDLRPPMHFWGIYPENEFKSHEAMVKIKLKPSLKIYNAFMHQNAYS
jgi:hypothetical protein